MDLIMVLGLGLFSVYFYVLAVYSWKMGEIIADKVYERRSV